MGSAILVSNDLIGCVWTIRFVERLGNCQMFRNFWPSIHINLFTSRNSCLQANYPRLAKVQWTKAIPQKNSHIVDSSVGSLLLMVISYPIKSLYSYLFSWLCNVQPLFFFFLKFHLLGVFQRFDLYFFLIQPQFSQFFLINPPWISHFFHLFDRVVAGWGYAFEPFELTLNGGALEAEAAEFVGKRCWGKLWAQPTNNKLCIIGVAKLGVISYNHQTIISYNLPKTEKKWYKPYKPLLVDDYRRLYYPVYRD